LNRSDWDAFDERHFTNPRILDLMKKINLLVDPEVERLYPKRRGCIVDVQCVNGDVFSGEVDYAWGEPENPLPAAMTREKFRKAAGHALSQRSMDRIEAMLEVAALTDSAESLFQVVTGAARAQRGITR
jgi:2-methylcitrate dehydratase PrpD